MTTIHWLGTGMSTSGPALRGLVERGRASRVLDRLVLWGRELEDLPDRIEELGVSDLVERGDVGVGRMANEDGYPAGVQPGDVVVSMLPGSEHARMARAALEAGAHFACTSYTSPELAEVAARAREAGLVFLTEAGLDPGIDHLLAHHLIQQARAEVGDQADAVRFTSYCGGLADDPGPFRYKFSWAPFGVLNALRSPATSIIDGRHITHERPWEATEPWHVGGERFEVYPNRDSVPFVEQYGIPSGWHLERFVRGTLRSDGWREAWEVVFETIQSGSEDDLRELAAELADRYPTSGDDCDRVMLEVALEVDSGERTWAGQAHLDVLGDDQQSAMARCVSETIAHGALQTLLGTLAPGPHRGIAEPAHATDWIEHLRDRGIPIHLTL